MELKRLSPKYNAGRRINVVNQRLGYLVRCGDPDAIDSIVPMAYGNLALDLILSSVHGRLVVLKNGRYDNVPVDVVTLATVTVAKAVLPRGHVLSAADLATDQRDVSRQLAGYFSNPGDLVGQRVKYQVIAGRVITPSMLQANNIIKRGQTVTITVNGAGIGVRMAGTALMDGALNQRIRVENRNSGRVVEGVVRSQEHVEIMVPSAGGFFPAKPKVSPPQADTKLSNNDR